jgi:hypothetical protein
VGHYWRLDSHQNCKKSFPLMCDVGAFSVAGELFVAQREGAFSPDQLPRPV